MLRNLYRLVYLKGEQSTVYILEFGTIEMSLVICFFFVFIIRSSLSVFGLDSALFESNNLKWIGSLNDWIANNPIFYMRTNIWTIETLIANLFSHLFSPQERRQSFLIFFWMAQHSNTITRLESLRVLYAVNRKIQYV